VRVIVADDSAVIRAGVVRILTGAGMDVVAEVRTADELLTAVAEHRPELSVVDIRMPPRDTAGLHAAVQIRDRYAGAVRVLVLSQYLEPDYALRLLGAGLGGVGYLLKDRIAEGGDLVEAAQRVGAGGTAIDPAVVEELVRARRRHDRLERLTSRERRVLALVAEGRSNRAIADHLGVAVKTIEGVIAVVFAKLELEPGPDGNRRVLAVLVHLNHAPPAD
jgi:DNA-binding NarL/FixJ family response regulator